MKIFLTVLFFPVMPILLAKILADNLINNLFIIPIALGCFCIAAIISESQISLPWAKTDKHVQQETSQLP